MEAWGIVREYYTMICTVGISSGRKETNYDPRFPEVRANIHRIFTSLCTNAILMNILVTSQFVSSPAIFKAFFPRRG
jgi:hypothetical protein